MDRASACGAEDPGSIPGERTTSLKQCGTALAAVLLLFSPARADFGSADGVLALEERPGWSVTPPPRGAVLSLRRDGAEFTVTPAADGTELFTLVAAEGLRLRRQGRKVAEPEPRKTTAGLAYMVAAVSAAGPDPDAVGALAVDKVRYLFRASGAPLTEVLALVDGIGRHKPADLSEAADAPDPGPDHVDLFGGKVRLPRPESGRLSPQADGWAVAVGRRWSLGVYDGGPAKPTAASARDYVRARAGELVVKRSCKAGDETDHPLSNGWTARLTPFACPDAVPGMVVLVGFVEREDGAPLLAAGDYGTASGLDQALGWLTSAADADLRPVRPAWPKPRLDRRSWAWAGLVLGSAGLFVLALRRR